MKKIFYWILNSLNRTMNRRFPRIYQEYLCWIFPVKEIYYELEVLKDVSE